MTDTIIPEVVADYYDATPTQRIDALRELGIYHDKMDTYSQGGDNVMIKFTVTKKEDLTTYKRGQGNSFAQRKQMRFHNSVSIQRDNKTEVFTFFGPVKCSYSEYPLNPKEYQADRFLGFLGCMMSEYDYLESEGIMDALDYMKYSDCSPSEARKSYAALRDTTDKLNNVLGQSLIRKIKHIMEGY